MYPIYPIYPIYPTYPTDLLLQVQCAQRERPAVRGAGGAARVPSVLRYEQHRGARPGPNRALPPFHACGTRDGALQARGSHGIVPNTHIVPKHTYCP